MCFLDLTSGGGASYNQPSSVTSSSSITIGSLYLGALGLLVALVAGAGLAAWAVLEGLVGAGVVVGFGATGFFGFLTGI